LDSTNPYAKVFSLWRETSDQRGGFGIASATGFMIFLIHGMEFRSKHFIEDSLSPVLKNIQIIHHDMEPFEFSHLTFVWLA
jgi:hypothetical protein